MIPGLGTPQPNDSLLIPSTVNIFGEARKSKSSKASRLSGLGYLGPSVARSIILKDFAGDDSASAKAADRIPWPTMPPPMSFEERQAYEKAEGERQRAELDREENEERNVADALPPELAAYLLKMPRGLRADREAAILREVGWEGLKLIGLDPMMLAISAETRARWYSEKFPRFDGDGKPINRQAEHNKGRCEKVHRRRLKRLQNNALLYVEAAIGAVGGPDVRGRPLYVSDYSLELYQQDQRRTEEILKGLRLVNVQNPEVQVPMNELNEAAKLRDAAKRRLMIDLQLMRWRVLGWSVCWITVTLPGRFVPHATNEGERVSEWDDRLGPLEAMQALQDDHHRVLAAAREAGVRPSGWWNAQPQQSGTPHRHYVLACRTLEEARMLCDQFRAKFSSRRNGDDVQERGCRAYVLGDEHADYRAPKGKNGEHETAESVAKYAARYSTRSEAKPQKAESEDEAALDTKASDQDRFRDWKRRRGARTHTWLGLDSGRAPSEMWDVLWANSMRKESDPDDPRIALAMQRMRAAQAYTEAAVECRERATEFPEGDEDRQAELDMAQECSEAAAREAWHAAIAVGLWPDVDLDPVEQEWLAGELLDVADPLPPVPLKEERESVYGETRKEIVGAIGVVEHDKLHGRVTLKKLLATAAKLGVWVEVPSSGKMKRGHALLALRQAGFRFSKRPCGAMSIFDLGGEILLRTEDDWQIVDEETAAQMLEEHKKESLRVEDMQREVSSKPAAETAPRINRIDIGTVGLSDSPTDPRIAPEGASHGGDRGVNHPPRASETFL